MSPRRLFSGRARWMSAVAVLAVAGVLTGTMLANAAGPALPKRTPAQLLVAMRDARPPAAMTAVVTENANLGFPSLPDVGGLSSTVFSAASWITGTHTVDIWYDGPRHVRIAVPVSFGETDLRVNGNQVWLWNSHGQTATHLILPTPQAVPGVHAIPVPVRPFGAPGSARALPPRCVVAFRSARPLSNPKAAKARILKCFHSFRFKIGPARVAPFNPPTPQQAASKFLAAIGPTTKVTVAGSTVVAGRPAYQLVIAPRTSESLISQIVIAVDSQTYLPLQLQVFARGTSSPAFQVGFTSLSFGKPAASNFTFTPPAGAHVKTEKISQLLPGGMPFAGAIPSPMPGPFSGQRFLQPPPGIANGIANWRPACAVLRPAGRVGPPRRVMPIRVAPGTKIACGPLVRRPVIIGKAPAGGTKSKAVAWYIGAIQNPPTAIASVTSQGPFSGPHGGVQVLGSGWLSVAVLPVGNALSAPMPQKAPLTAGGTAQASPPSAGGQIQAPLRILLNSATRVHGPWGSGRLIRTSLVSALITDKGKLLIGAVTPSVLYADAAKVK